MAKKKATKKTAKKTTKKTATKKKQVTKFLGVDILPMKILHG